VPGGVGVRERFVFEELEGERKNYFINRLFEI